MPRFVDYPSCCCSFEFRSTGRRRYCSKHFFHTNILFDFHRIFIVTSIVVPVRSRVEKTHRNPFPQSQKIQKLTEKKLTAVKTALSRSAVFWSRTRACSTSQGQCSERIRFLQEKIVRPQNLSINDAYYRFSQVKIFVILSTLYKFFVFLSVHKIYQKLINISVVHFHLA